jgi:hypothetical protein
VEQIFDIIKELHATGVTILLMQNQKDGDGTLIGKIRSLIYLS